MSKNLEHYFRYFFNKFYDNYIIIKESAKESTPNENETDTPQNMDFKTFLILELTPGSEDKEAKLEKINELSEDITDEQFNEVKDIFETIKKEQKTVIQYGLNFEDEDDDDNYSIKVFKALYKSFKDKIVIPEFSENTKQILQFFNEFDYEQFKEKQEKMIQTKEENRTTEEQAIEEFVDAFHILQSSIEINETNILKVLEKDLTRLVTIVKNKKKIYIPFFGGSSAGKSTILNNILGYTIFPQAQDECTTRGIILEYSNDVVPELYQCVSKQELDYYCFEKSGFPLAIGAQNIYRYLYSLNSMYANEEEKCFFILKTPIEFFNLFQFSEELKSQVCFIDLPGGDTNNNRFNNPTLKDRSIYEKLLKMSISFIFINKGRHLKDTKNIIVLRNSFNKICDEIKISNPNENRIELLKSCLFVINMFTELKEEEKDLNILNKEIVSYLFADSNPQYEKNTKAVFMDAKSYQEYIREKKNFMNLTNYLDKLLFNFNQYQKDYNFNIFGFFGKSNNFVDYCVKELNEKVKSLTFEDKFGNKIKIDKKKKPNDKFYNEITTFMNTRNIEIKSKNMKKLGEFVSIYEQVQNNINSINLFKKSNHEEFFSKLKVVVDNCKEIAEKNYKEYLIHTIRHFDEFFSIDIKNKKNKNEIESIKLRDTFFQKFDEIVKLTINKTDNIFDEMNKQLVSNLEKEKENVKKILEENEKSVEKSLKYISTELNKKVVQEHGKKIETELQESNSKIENVRKEYEEKLKLLEKSSSLDEKVTDFSMDLKDNDYFRTLLSCLSLGIGVGGTALLAFILGVAAIPGVGWAAAAILTVGGLIGLIFNDSDETKLIKQIDQIINTMNKNINSKKRSFILNIKDYYAKLRDDYDNKTSLDISNLENVKLENFNESKTKYLQAKKLLGF